MGEKCSTSKGYEKYVVQFFGWERWRIAVGGIGLQEMII
jgi:hypothetical protein